MRLYEITRAFLATALLLATAAPAITAQQPAAAPATISGIAFDSVRGRPMNGAQIAVQGTTLLTTAGADGHFKFDSVAPGKYRLIAGHPILDSIGIQLVTAEIAVAAGQQLTINMSTPSAAALVKQLCPAAWLTRGPAALFGRVRNADTEQPIAKARVSIVWTEQVLGLEKVPKMREATTGDDGTYRICGLPGSLDGKVQVERAGLKSGDVPVTLDKNVLELRSLSLASAEPVTVAAAGDTNPPPRRALTVAQLRGKVYSVTGAPVSGARIQVEGTPHTTDSRSDGSFLLDSLPSGSQVVIARLIGYNPVEQSVELSSNAPAVIALRFDRSVALLPTVRTEAVSESGLDAVGFNQRKKTGMGFMMDSKQIDKLGAVKVTDVLRMAPGISVVSSGYDTYVYDTRTQGQGCVTYVVDNSPWTSMSPGDIDSFLQPGNLGAIEVYHGAETPPQFQSGGEGGCATIVIWSKWWLDRRTSKAGKK